MKALLAPLIPPWLNPPAPAAAVANLQVALKHDSVLDLFHYGNKAGAWTGQAFEIDNLQDERQVAELMQQLSDRLASCCAEVMVALHRLPVQARDDAPSGNLLAPLLAPVGPSSRVRCYLFVRARTGQGQALQDQLIPHVLQSWQVRAQSLPQAQVQELQTRWMSESQPPVETVHLDLFPRRHSCALSMLPVFLELAPATETWTYGVLQFLSGEQAARERARQPEERARELRATGQPLVHARFGCLVRCAPSLLQQVAVLRQQCFRGGINVGAASRSPLGVVWALPWVLPVGKACRATWHRPNLWQVGELAQALPFKQGRTQVVTQLPGALPVLSQHQEVVALAPAHGCITNPNVLVMGQAGAGSTFLVNAMLAQHLDAGGHAWAIRWAATPVFDDVLSVQRHDMRPDRTQSLNPFTFVKTELEFHSAVDVLKGWIATLAGLEADGEEIRYGGYPGLLEHLELALQDAWRVTRDQTDLWHVIEQLEARNEASRMLATRLRQRLTDVGPDWFRGPCTIDPGQPYQSFDLQGFAGTADESLIACSLLTLYSLLQPQLLKHQRRMLVVDEAQVLGTDCAWLLQQVLRRGRWYGCSHVITTQPFPAQPLNQSRVEQTLQGCQHHVLLQTQPDRLQPWLERLAPNTPAHLLSHQIKTFRLNRSRFFWSHGEGWSLCEFGPGIKGCMALTTDPREQKLYFAAREAGSSVQEALAHAAEQTVKMLERHQRQLDNSAGTAR